MAKQAPLPLPAPEETLFIDQPLTRPLRWCRCELDRIRRMCEEILKLECFADNASAEQTAETHADLRVVILHVGGAIACADKILERIKKIEQANA